MLDLWFVDLSRSFDVGTLASIEILGWSIALIN